MHMNLNQLLLAVKNDERFAFEFDFRKIWKEYEMVSNETHKDYLQYL